jgi:hypothetical protein
MSMLHVVVFSYFVGFFSDALAEQSANVAAVLAKVRGSINSSAFKS